MRVVARVPAERLQGRGGQIQPVVHAHELDKLPRLTIIRQLENKYVRLVLYQHLLRSSYNWVQRNGASKPHRDGVRHPVSVHLELHQCSLLQRDRRPHLRNRKAVHSPR